MDKNTGNQIVMGGFGACAGAQVFYGLGYFFGMIFKNAYSWGLVRLLYWLGAWIFILGVLAIAGGFAMRFLAGQDILDAGAAGCAGLYGLLALIGRFANYPVWLSRYAMGFLLLGLFAVLAVRFLKKSNMPWCAISAAAGLWIAFIEPFIRRKFVFGSSHGHFFYYLVLLFFAVTICAAWGAGLLAAKDTND